MSQSLKRDPYVGLHKFGDVYALYHPLSHEVVCGDEGLVTYWENWMKDKIPTANTKNAFYAKLLKEANFISSDIETPLDTFQSYLKNWLERES